MHILDIDIDDNLSVKSFRITDNSVYDDSLDVKNLLLEITPPKSDFIIPVRVNKGFTKILNSNLLRLNSSGANSLSPIPDGLYKISFSVAPNKDVKEDYYYFRNVKQVNRYLLLLTNLLRDRINLNKESFNKRKEELLWIHQLIRASKYTAEDSHDVDLALDEYKAIDELILKYERRK